ncbi:uncharacterized protein BKA78DRAFT_10213 [Phyllosticta capitalensis]|uniref:uncharacterized protein n=1 Tax=Phyllosticta capitalensis TaxID=121624 RepID=UPI00312CFB9B
MNGQVPSTCRQRPSSWFFRFSGMDMWTHATPIDFTTPPLRCHRPCALACDNPWFVSPRATPAGLAPMEMGGRRMGRTAYKHASRTSVGVLVLFCPSTTSSRPEDNVRFQGSKPASVTSTMFTRWHISSHAWHILCLQYVPRPHPFVSAFIPVPHSHPASVHPRSPYLPLVFPASHSRLVPAPRRLVPATAKSLQRLSRVYV